eukprot:8146660-Pyramimonas_sp.AAC.2
MLTGRPAGGAGWRERWRRCDTRPPHCGKRATSALRRIENNEPTTYKYITYEENFLKRKFISL